MIDFMSTISPLTKRGRLLTLLRQMQNDRAAILGDWRDCADFIQPASARFTYTDVNKYNKRGRRIIDSTATFSAGTLSSGMMSGITSPARQWFRLTTPDPDLNELQEVKEWLHVTTQRINDVLTRSNFYNSVIELYDCLGTFGTAALSILEDSRKVIHTECFAIGSYMLGVDHKRRVQMFAREYQLKAWQIVQLYGVANPDRPDWSNIDWKNISNVVHEYWDKKQYEQLVPVVQMILPNWGIGGSYDGQSMLSENKRYASYIFEVASDGEKILECSGFDEFPVMAPRWSVTGEDSYASRWPGLTALGDVKQLQQGEKMGLKAIDKMVDPPLTGPTRLKRARVSVLPSDITYADVREGELGLRPTYQVNFDIDKLEMKQQQCRARIERAFFADLFLMISQSEAMDRRTDITAREIEERHEEKYIALGPVLERLNEDFLDPTIDRVYNIMERRGMIPEVPEMLSEVPLKVEYISVMAQAQKMLGLAGIERTANFVGSVAKVKPDVFDKFNMDEAIDAYGDMAGIPPRLIVSDEDVQRVRQARAQAEAAAQRSAVMEQQAKSAKLLSETNTSGDNGLTALLRGALGPGQVPDQNAALDEALAEPASV